MICYNKNKNELFALTGAVYSFVAYLTAFTLEILFIIELAKRSNGSVAITITSATPAASPSQSTSTSAESYNNEDPSSFTTFDQAKLALESMQTHLTISCLAISILYFVLFITSLVLIVALILRSTLFILIWNCVMITMYLPEFCLIIYVSKYGWGLDTRNGQTELIFYLFRAVLNVIFIFRAIKLYKEWTHEKNFFTLKSGRSRFSGYDSPYFIGDSLTTTINPMFSSSSLDRYDQVRDLSNTNPYPDFNIHPTHLNDRKMSGFCLFDESRENYIANGDSYRQDHFAPQSRGVSMIRQNSVHSVNNNDEYADLELDLDYRTLTNQLHYQQDLNESPAIERSQATNLARSSCGLSYSTQSLDRRHLRDLPQMVLLRPLGHQPFDYLNRPGSSSNLSSTNNLNPSTYSSSTKLAMRSGANDIRRYA